MFNKLVVLVVDGHHDVLHSLTLFIQTFPDVDILTANSFGAAAVWIDGAKRIDLLIADTYLRGDMSGIDVAQLAVASNPALAVVMMSTELRANIRGLPERYAFIQKPFGVHELTEHIDSAFVRLQAARLDFYGPTS